jgi:hypothetical protein
MILLYVVIGVAAMLTISTASFVYIASHAPTWEEYDD